MALSFNVNFEQRIPLVGRYRQCRDFEDTSPAPQLFCRGPLKVLPIEQNLKELRRLKGGCAVWWESLVIAGCPEEEEALMLYLVEVRAAMERANTIDAGDVGIEPLLKRKDVRAFVPQLAILRKKERRRGRGHRRGRRARGRLSGCIHYNARGTH